MNVDQIKKKLHNGWIGQKINFKPEVNSTNTWALQSLETDARRGDVFLTDFQTEGRGRLGRKWEGAKEKNIFISIIDQKPTVEAQTPQLTLIAGLGFLEGLQSLFPQLSLTLKWPNDILLEGKKIGGILIESHSSQPYLTVGVGLNINMKKSEFSSEVQKTAISLSEAMRHSIEREPVMAACLNHYEKWRDLLDKKGVAPILEAWKKKSSTLNRKVKVDDGNKSYEGTAVDLDPSGFLIVETTGKRKTVISADVTLM